jgi:hypothetical protein
VRLDFNFTGKLISSSSKIKVCCKKLASFNARIDRINEKKIGVKKWQKQKKIVLNKIKVEKMCNKQKYSQKPVFNRT